MILTGEKMVVYFSLSDINRNMDNPCIMPLKKFMKEFDYAYG